MKCPVCGHKTYCLDSDIGKYLCNYCAKDYYVVVLVKDNERTTYWLTEDKLEELKEKLGGLKHGIKIVD